MRQVSVIYRQVTDRSSLMNFFSVSAKAKASSILGVKVSASAAFSRNVQLAKTANGVNLAVDARIQEAVDAVAPLPPVVGDSAVGGAAINSVQLSPSAAAIARSDPLRFKKLCGDGFVSTIKRGSAIQGAYIFHAQTIEEKKSIQGSVAGAYGPFSSNASGQSKIEEMQSKSRLSISYFQLGGVGTAIATDHKTFKELVGKVGEKSDATSGSPFEVGITPYSDIFDFGDDSANDRALNGLVNQYYRLENLNDVISDLLGESSAEPWLLVGGPMSVAQLKVVQDDLRKEMRMLLSSIKVCVDDGVGCAFPEGAATNDYGFRSRLPLRSLPIIDVRGHWLVAEKLPANITKYPATRACYIPSIGLGSGEPCVTLHHDQCTAMAAAASCVAQAHKPHPWDAGLKCEQIRLNNCHVAVVGNLSMIADRFRYWVESVSEERCRDAQDDACLSSGELREYALQMFPTK